MLSRQRLAAFVRREIFRQRAENGRPEIPFARNVQAPSEAEENHQEWVLGFLRPCYIAAGMFFAITAWQWIIIAHIFARSGTFMIAGFVCLLIAFAVLFTLTVCVHFRRIYLFSCIMAWIFVETAAMGMILVLPKRTLDYVCLTMLLALIVLFLCYLTGAWVHRVILPGEITMCICLIIFIVTSITMLTLYIVTDQAKYKTLYFMLLGVFMIPTAIYHAQIIHGRRFHVPIEEHVNLAVSLHLNFLMFFASIYYGLWVHEW